MRRYLLALLLCLNGLGPARASEPYPTKPVTLVVPFAAGSGTDSVARVVVQRLSEVLKANIVIENRAGANGAIGAAMAARATPDGYTLFAGGVSTHAANPSLLKSIQYDPKADFEPISQFGLFPYFMFTPKNLAASSVAEIVAMAKARPGEMSFAYANATGQLAGEMLKKRAGVNLVAVPYKASPQAVIDVGAGRVSMIFVDLTAAVSLVKSGDVRVLATTTSSRSALYPEAPSMKEAGIDLFDLSVWTGLFAPKNTPPAIVSRLSEAVKLVLGEPEVKAKLAAIGFEAQWQPANAFAKRVSDDIALWETLTREAGIERQ